MNNKTNKLLYKLSKLHPKYIDLSLDRLSKLLYKLGNPHLDLPKTIHIAGTNGKGSIQSFIRNILISNGYSCDAYISPHLSKFNERIVINNRDISTKKLYDTLKFVEKINDNNEITFFEITTAVAFVLFQRSKSEFLVLETGLGGRLDATNIIPKKLFSIITPISYDHEEYLGNTIKKITIEKLGIIKNSKNIIISKQKEEVEKFIRKKLSGSKNLYFYGNNFRVSQLYKHKFEFKFSIKKKLVSKPKMNGLHQIENASVALAFSELMKDQNFDLSDKRIDKAIKNTAWPGRLEMLNYKNKNIILDGSHNIDGAKKLNEFLRSKKIRPVVLFGMINNKKIFNFLKIISNRISYLLALKIPNEKNAFTVNEIGKHCHKLSINYIKIKNINEALRHIRNSDQKYFLITGSLYLVGRIRKRFIN